MEAPTPSTPPPPPTDNADVPVFVDSKITGIFDFTYANLPGVLVPAAMEASSMVSDIVSPERRQCIAHADGAMLRHGGGAVSPFRRTARVLQSSGAYVVGAPVALAAAGAPHEAPWTFSWRKVFASNVEPTALAKRVLVARKAEEAGFDAGYQRFRRHDADGILALLPGLLIQQEHQWLSWTYEMAAHLAWMEKSPDFDALIAAGPWADARATDVAGVVVPDFWGQTRAGVFGDPAVTVGRASDRNPRSWEGQVDIRLPALPASAVAPAAAAGVVPPLTGAWVGVVPRPHIAEWIEQATAGRITARVYVARARTLDQLLGELAGLGTSAHRSGFASWADPDQSVWVLAPHIGLPQSGVLDFGRVQWTASRRYNWAVVLQAVALGTPEVVAQAGTSRDVLALVRHLAVVRAAAVLPAAGDAGGHEAWHTELGSSPWQVRLAAALDVAREIGGPGPTYLQAGGALTHLLAFEAVRLGRGFDRVWNRVCGEPGSLTGWGGLGSWLWAAGYGCVNALYGSSGDKPLGVFFVTTPPAVFNAADTADVRVYLRQRWASFGWPQTVPSEWSSLDARGAARFQVSPRGKWVPGGFDQRTLTWGMVLAAESGSNIRLRGEAMGVPDTQRALDFRVPAAGTGVARCWEPFDVPVEWLKSSFSGFESAAFFNVADGQRSRLGVLWAGDVEAEGAQFLGIVPGDSVAPF